MASAAFAVTDQEDTDEPEAQPAPETSPAVDRREERTVLAVTAVLREPLLLGGKKELQIYNLLDQSNINDTLAALQMTAKACQQMEAAITRQLARAALVGVPRR